MEWLVSYSWFWVTGYLFLAICIQALLPTDTTWFERLVYVVWPLVLAWTILRVFVSYLALITVLLWEQK